MPIIVKNVEWRETENSIIIKVPIRVRDTSKADVMYSSFYLKASFEQFYFESFLLHSVDPDKSCCIFTETDIVFELTKCGKQLWHKLQREFVNTHEKEALKKTCIEETEKRIQHQHKVRSDVKDEMKRLLVREQLSIESSQRTAIDAKKKSEKEKALEHIFCANAHKNSIPECKRDLQQIPLPRSLQIINVDFTPREFPTPIRESRLQEENEWLEKQIQARRCAGFLSEDLRSEEKSPQCLKEKGDQFMKNNNYLGAISAYTFGLKLSQNFVDLYIARSAAHLAINNYNKAIQDCSAALELLKPEVPVNLTERALCIGRRGIGLIKLGLINHGMQELKASLNLMPNTEFEQELNHSMNLLKDIKEEL